MLRCLLARGRARGRVQIEGDAYQHGRVRMPGSLSLDPCVLTLVPEIEARGRALTLD